jgi:23S rRNA pseudouridine2605 synthase
MNKVHDVPAEEPQAAQAAEDNGVPPEAPRRRRARKSVESPEGGSDASGAPEAVTAAPSSDEPAAAEPKRRGRPRKAVAAEAGADPAAMEAAAAPPPVQAADAPPAAFAPREPQPPAQQAFSFAAASPPPASPVASQASVAQVSTPPAFELTLGPAEEAAPGASGSQPEAAAGAGPAGEFARNRGDRNNNRRRGRRGRGDRADAPGAEGPADAESAAAEGAPRPPRPAPDAGERFADVVSGAYDTEVPAPEIAAPVEGAAASDVPVLGKRVLRPEPEAPKLHKVLAQSGVGSRRDMEQLIQDGRVTVNGEPAHIGMRIAQGDRIAVGGKPVKVRIAPPPARVLAYHKPVGEVVTFNDPEGRPTVFRNLPRLPHGKWQSVGRLDINTEGLLLFTTSGDLANQLMHPRFGVEREYAVRVLGDLDADLRAELLEGVDIDGQRCAFRSIHDGGGEGANRWYRVVITEGRHREVRRMFEEVGLVVSRLIRIRYGVVVLPKGLHRGEWVELDDDDVRAIRRLAHGNPQQQGDGQRDGPRPGHGGNNSNNKGGRDRRGKPQRPDRPAHAYAGDSGEAMPAQAQGAQGDDFGPDDPLHIPNPLEQTFDRRFATGSKRITAGFGRPSDDAHRSAAERKGAKGGPKQPDPMQTSVGYIGADAYFSKPGGGNRRRGGGGGGGGGGRGR